jgi:hypothetical protein
MAFLAADRPSNHQPTSITYTAGQLCLKAELLHSYTLNDQLNDLWLHWLPHSCFQNRAALTPYKHLPVNLRLQERNSKRVRVAKSR